MCPQQNCCCRGWKLCNIVNKWFTIYFTFGCADSLFTAHNLSKRQFAAGGCLWWLCKWVTVGSGVEPSWSMVCVNDHCLTGISQTGSRPRGGLTALLVSAESNEWESENMKNVSNAEQKQCGEYSKYSKGWIVWALQSCLNPFHLTAYVSQSKGSSLICSVKNRRVCMYSPFNFDSSFEPLGIQRLLDPCTDLWPLSYIISTSELGYWLHERLLLLLLKKEIWKRSRNHAAIHLFPPLDLYSYQPRFIADGGSHDPNR